MNPSVRGRPCCADNVCVGGKVDVAMNSEAVIKGLVIDRNVFRPTPGTPGQKFPILIRYLNPNLPPPVPAHQCDVQVHCIQHVLQKRHRGRRRSIRRLEPHLYRKDACVRQKQYRNRLLCRRVH